jgi:hypothetical protein
LRAGEWIMVVAGLALIVDLLAVPWYGLSGTYAEAYRQIGAGPENSDGIQSLHVLGPLALLAGVGGLSSGWLQATRRAPAVPVCAAALTTVLSTLVLIGLFVRVLIVQPGSATYIEAKAGAYAGLALSALLVLGGYRSLRQDGIHAADAPQQIETLRLAPGRRTP